MPFRDGRIYIEKINEPFLFEPKGTPAEYKASLVRAIAKGWLEARERHLCASDGATMNPLDWRREHLFAWILFCLVGALIGSCSRGSIARFGSSAASPFRAILPTAARCFRFGSAIRLNIV